MPTMPAAFDPPLHRNRSSLSASGDDRRRRERFNRMAGVVTVLFRERWLDVTIEGEENIPDHGGVIVAANHLSFIDSMLVMYGLERPVSFLGKAEYMDSPLTRRLFPATGMIPVDRSGKGVAASLRTAQHRIEAGEMVGIFPEGTRSRDGRLHRGHTGAAHLALKTGAPIVPAGLIGTAEALPPGARLPRRTPITIRFGAPIGRPPLLGLRHGRESRQALTDEVMASIASLSGQEFVNELHPIAVG